MKKFIGIFGLAVGLTFLLASASIGLAEDLLPQQGAFHLDLRALNMLNISGGNLAHDGDPADKEKFTTLTGSLGSTVTGMKIGYLISGYHDVGAHFLFSHSTVWREFDPEDSAAEKEKTRDRISDFRMVAYYNYNFHAGSFVMPYVGPMLGVYQRTDAFTNPDDSNQDTTTVNNGGIFGVEGGVKLFPYQHVAFDLGLMFDYASIGQNTSYGDDRLEDDKWKGGSLEFGIVGGLNVYF